MILRKNKTSELIPASIFGENPGKKKSRENPEEINGGNS